MISKIFLIGCLAAVTYSLPLESLNPEGGVYAVDQPTAVDYASQGEAYDRVRREGGVYAAQDELYRLDAADHTYEGEAYDRVRRESGVYAAQEELQGLDAANHAYEGEEYDRVKREGGVYAAQDELYELDAADHAYEGEYHERTKRATCDLLSFQSKWLTLNDSACAAHCIAMLKGYKGGYCKNSICHCRK